MTDHRPTESKAAFRVLAVIVCIGSAVMFWNIRWFLAPIGPAALLWLHWLVKYAPSAEENGMDWRDEP